ncbi:hypothetical protein CLOP_g11998, partial [Closterium sp. NIES-67]
PSTDKVQPTDFQVSLRGDTNSKVSAFNFWSRGPDTLYAEGSLYGFPCTHLFCRAPHLYVLNSTIIVKAV